MTFKAAHEWPAQYQHGPVKHSVNVQSTCSGGFLFNLRSQGPGAATMGKAMTAPDGSTLPEAEQQKRMMDLIMRTESMANWISSGVPLADDASLEDMQAASAAFIEACMATATMNYSFVTKGVGLVNESGSKYDLVSNRTFSGSGKVTVGTSLTFELDAQTHHYSLNLPHEFEDKTDSLGKEVTVDSLSSSAGAPDVKRNERVIGLDYPSHITMDDPKMLMGTILLIEGDFDPAATKITGERTLAAHYEDASESVPGTLLVKYTLTPK